MKASQALATADLITYTELLENTKRFLCRTYMGNYNTRRKSCFPRELRGKIRCPRTGSVRYCSIYLSILPFILKSPNSPNILYPNLLFFLPVVKPLATYLNEIKGVLYRMSPSDREGVKGDN